MLRKSSTVFAKLSTTSLSSSSSKKLLSLKSYMRRAGLIFLSFKYAFWTWPKYDPSYAILVIIGILSTKSSFYRSSLSFTIPFSVNSFSVKNLGKGKGRATGSPLIYKLYPRSNLTLRQTEFTWFAKSFGDSPSWAKTVAPFIKNVCRKGWEVKKPS